MHHTRHAQAPLDRSGVGGGWGGRCGEGRSWMGVALRAAAVASDCRGSESPAYLPTTLLMHASSLRLAAAIDNHVPPAHLVRRLLAEPSWRAATAATLNDLAAAVYSATAGYWSRLLPQRFELALGRAPSGQSI